MAEEEREGQRLRREDIGNGEMEQRSESDMTPEMVRLYATPE